MILGAAIMVQAQVSFGKPGKINEQWQFYLGDSPDEKTQWQTLNLPHDWSVQQPSSPTYASCQGFLPGGVGWYRKSLHIPAEREGERVYLYFEGIYNRSEVFVNGKSVGSRPNGYISFAFDVTDFVKFGADNLVAIRVDHSQSADSRWYTGSGIYRNVWMVYANPIHIAQWGVYACPQKNGVMNVEVEVQNQSGKDASLQVMNELFDDSGKPVAKKTSKIAVAAQSVASLQSVLSVKHPALWDLDNPTLYTLKTTILQDGKVIDKTETRTGFRNFSFDANKGFFLNGQNMKVKGVCIHHDAGVLGSAIPREVWKRRLLTLKEIGANAIRTSHNPQAPDLYALCDELGILVLNEAYDEWEFPKNKWIEGWNVGTPGHEGSFDIFTSWGERDLADMVRRDRNHLSIFAWSIGNEVDYPNDPYSHPVLDGKNDGFTQKIFGGYRPDAPEAERLGDIAKRLVTAVKKYDKSRPVTAGLAGVAMSNETEYPAALDIHGYNYTESRYQSDHKQYPARVLFGSENRHDYEAWRAVADNEYVFGQFLWTGIDYLGESGTYPSRGFYSGLVDFGGFIKPRGYFRQSLWSNKPMIYIGAYPISKNDRSIAQLSIDASPVWNYKEGQTIRVVCYTNADKAKLLLNGDQIGNTKNYDNKTGILFWDIPYQAGKLEAVGMDSNGVETSRYTIQTSKQPYAITAAIIPSDNQKSEVAQIVIQIVDEDGVPVLLSDNEITCHITGNATLLGLEASNNSDMGDYTDNRQRVYLGRMIAYIQLSDKSEGVSVAFFSPWLKSTQINVFHTFHPGEASL
jgi:beta-galactosidase/beta-glucuronidase